MLVSENVHLSHLFPLSIFFNLKWGQTGTLLSDQLHPHFSQLVLCVDCCWMCKVFLTLPCYPGAPRICVCDLHIAGGCVRASSPRNDETQCIYAYVCSRMCLHFVSGSTRPHPPPPLVITLRFNPPPHLSASPSLYPEFPLGMWLMLQRVFVHRAQVTQKIEGSAFLGSSGSGGETEGGPGAVSQLQKNNPAEEKGKYGLSHDMSVCWPRE